MKAQTLQLLLATLCLLSVLGVAVVVTITAGAAGLGAYALVLARFRHIFKPYSLVRQDNDHLAHARREVAPDLRLGPACRRHAS